MIFKKKLMDERRRSGFCHDWSRIPAAVTDIADVRPDAQTVRFTRLKKSHEGLGKFRNIRCLFADNVDDAFLEEISRLSALTYLWAEVVTAQNLSPLNRLETLEFLILRRVRNAKAFSFVTQMPKLRHLCLEWVKHLTQLDDFTNKRELLSFGIEGATAVSATQRIESLAPILGWERLEALYLTNTRILDGNLHCLGQIKTLRHLETARFYPKTEFDALKSANPNLKCDWFDQWEIGSFYHRR